MCVCLHTHLNVHADTDKCEMRAEQRNSWIWQKQVVEGLMDLHTLIYLGNSKTNQLQIRNEACRQPNSLKCGWDHLIVSRT